MIKLFRRIRQRLLNESLPASKTGRYLIYAAGEILLVVIGILIALAVNNWNQQANDRRSGEELLSRIHRDLVKDTSDFKRIVRYNTKLREDMRDFLTTLYNGVESIEVVKKLSAVYDLALDQVFAPNDNTYSSIINSGSLGLIQNQSLKEEIVNLYSEYGQVSALLSSINEWMGGIASNVDIETDFIKFNSQVSDIYTTPEMLNESDFTFLNNKEDPRFKLIVRAISATAFNQKVRNGYYLELIKKCEKLILLIEQELT